MTKREGDIGREKHIWREPREEKSPDLLSKVVADVAHDIQNHNTRLVKWYHQSLVAFEEDQREIIRLKELLYQ